MRTTSKTLAFLASLAPLACGGAGDAAVRTGGPERPVVLARTSDGLVALGPLTGERTLFVLPSASRSSVVPRMHCGERGIELVVAAGSEPLAIRALRASAVVHASDGRVLLTPDGPALFGPPRAPLRTRPLRALAALARQDGATAVAGELAVEASEAFGELVVVAGDAHGAGAPWELEIDGEAIAFTLGTNHAIAVPGATEHVLRGGATALDHAAFRERRELPRAEPIATVAPADIGRGARVPAGGELAWLLAPPPAAGEGEVVALLLEIESDARADAAVRASTPRVTAETRSEWLRDVATAAPGGEHELAGLPDGLLVHFEGPDEQLDIRPTMGPGAALGDYDGDGHVDVYLVQGEGREGSEPNPNRLLRNLGPGRGFEDVTERAGVGDRGAGMGALFVDLDGDGRLDLYVANRGRDALFLNRGGGTFRDASDRLPGHELWSAGVAAADFDGDDDLDLYVTSYLDYDLSKLPPAAELGRYQREDPVEMLPFAFPGQRNVLLRNDGVDGAGELRLVDVTEELGVADAAGRGMQPVFWDFDRDGDQDLYVANDVSLNVLFRNEGDGTFEDVSFSTGLDDPRGGMGLAVGDVDRDGDEDVLLTNWQLETNALYLSNLYTPRASRTRHATFHDATLRAGLARPSIGVTSWGAVLFDLELDGDLDLFVANGYTSPDYESTGACVGQPNHLFKNRGDGRFTDAHDVAPTALSVRHASRGAAGADLDRDGDVDLLVTANNGPVQLLVNESPRHGRWLGIELRQPGANRFAIGAEVTVEVDAPGAEGGVRRFRRSLRAGEGYLVGNAPELHFGLGDAARIARVVVRWPDGAEQEHRVETLDRWVRLER